MTQVEPHPRVGGLEPDQQWYQHRVAKVALAFVAVVVLTTLQLYRQAGIRSWNTIWAEDGAIFFQAGNHVSSVYRTYSGYLELLPRMIGLVANLVPIAQVSRFLTGTSAVLTSVSAVGLFVISRPLVPSRALRFVLAASTFAIPAALVENLNSTTNLIWLLLFLNLWILLIRPQTRSRAVGFALVAFLSATSTVLAAFYVPLAGLLTWKRRDPESRIVVVGYAVGLAVQALFVLTAHDDSPQSATRVGDLLPLYGVRVLGSGVLGDSLMTTAWADHGYAVGAFAALVVGAIVVALALRTRGTHQCLGLATVAYSVFVYVGALALRGSDDFLPVPQKYFQDGARFVVLALWILLSGVAVLLSGARMSGAARRVCIAVFVAQFVLVGVANYRATNGRSGGPAWNESVAAAQAVCEGPSAHATVAVPITPPGWSIKLSCDRLAR